MAYSSARARYREEAIQRIKQLESRYGENSFIPELVEARVTVWALEFADNPTEENFKRLQRVVQPEANMTAIEVHPKGSDKSTVDPNVQRLRVIGYDGNKHLFREDRIAELNPVSTRWDGSKITLNGARNSFEDFFIVVESIDSVDEDFTITVDPFVGAGFTIQNTSPDPQNRRDRPIKVHKAAYVKSRGLSWFAADYKLDGSPLGPGYRESHRWGPWRSDDGSRLAESRPALGKHMPSFWMDTVFTEVGDTFTAVGDGNEQVHIEVFLPKTAPAGTYTSTVTVTSVTDGNSYEIPVELELTAVTLADTDETPYLLYINADSVSDRVNGDGFKFPNVGSAEASLRDEMVDLAYQATRSCRMLPTGHEQSSGTGTVTVPDAKLAARLLGTLYDGPTYLGPGVLSQLSHTFLGVYARWKAWPGINGEDLTGAEPAALSGLLDAWDTWVAANGFTGLTIPFITDEPNTLELLQQIQIWASWFSGRGYAPFTTPLSAHDTAANFEDMIAICPDIRAFMINTPVLPKDTPDIIDNDFRSLPGTRLFGLYNKQSPMAHSHMMDDRLDGHIIDGLAQLKQGGYDLDFYWGGFEFINNEAFGRHEGFVQDGVDLDLYRTDTGEEAYRIGSDDRGRANFWQTNNTFGANLNPDNRRPTHGDAGHLYSEGDGILFVSGLDAWFSDAPQVKEFFPTMRALMIRRRRQFEQVTRQALVANPAPTQTLLSALIPAGAFSHELGVQADGLVNEERSYHQTDRLLDQIDSDDVGQFYVDVLPLAV